MQNTLRRRGIALASLLLVAASMSFSQTTSPTTSRAENPYHIRLYSAAKEYSWHKLGSAELVVRITTTRGAKDLELIQLGVRGQNLEDESSSQDFSDILAADSNIPNAYVYVHVETLRRHAYSSKESLLRGVVADGPLLSLTTRRVEAGGEAYCISDLGGLTVIESDEIRLQARLVVDNVLVATSNTFDVTIR